ncbi:MAG: hypothetical protein WCJ69_16805 [Betaproteobacteria bacterium]
MASPLAANRPALRFVLGFAAAFALLHLARTAARRSHALETEAVRRLRAGA